MHARTCVGNVQIQLVPFVGRGTVHGSGHADLGGVTQLTFTDLDLEWTSGDLATVLRNFNHVRSLLLRLKCGNAFAKHSTGQRYN